LFENKVLEIHFIYLLKRGEYIMMNAYSSHWFYDILQCNQKDRSKNISKIGSKKHFLNTVNKDFLLTIFENKNQEERVLAAEILIYFFPHNCNLEICFEGQRSESIFVHQLSMHLARNFSKKYLEDQMNILLKSQKSDNANIQKLGIELLTIHFPKPPTFLEQHVENRPSLTLSVEPHYENYTQDYYLKQKY
jgi:hypothetical protein